MTVTFRCECDEDFSIKLASCLATLVKSYLSIKSNLSRWMLSCIPAESLFFVRETLLLWCSKYYCPSIIASSLSLPVSSLWQFGTQSLHPRTLVISSDIGCKIASSYSAPLQQTVWLWCSSSKSLFPDQEITRSTWRLWPNLLDV